MIKKFYENLKKEFKKTAAGVQNEHQARMQGSFAGEPVESSSMFMGTRGYKENYKF